MATLDTIAPPTCPACGAAGCRRSRWRSHAEHAGNPGMHPWRCLACSHRFVAPDHGSGGRRSGPLVVGVLAALALLAIIGGSVMVASDDDASTPAPAAATAAETVAVAVVDPLDAHFRAARAALLDSARDSTITAEAVARLRQAAEGGHTGAMVLLGKLYRSGVGMPQNYALAARWLGAAAEAGDPEGMVEYGRLHRSGIGVALDAVKAYVWFNRAAALLNMDGVQERDSIAVKLSEDELRRAQALSLEAIEATASQPETGSR